MSLASIAQSLVMGEFSPVMKLVIWVINQIDMLKFVERTMEATNFPDTKVKCVLLEYNFTPWSTIKAGLPDISDRMPGTDQFIHTLMHQGILNKLEKYICGDNINARIYRRRKINRDENKPCPHKWQLVVVFNDRILPETGFLDDDDKSTAKYSRD